MAVWGLGKSSRARRGRCFAIAAQQFGEIDWVDHQRRKATVARRVGNVSGDQDVSGFSVISARDLDHAVEIAQGCPAIAQGYGLEVGELMTM